MAAELKRMTFTLSPEIEKELDSLKQEIFYMNTQSYMIRELIMLGIQVTKEEKGIEGK